MNLISKHDKKRKPHKLRQIISYNLEPRTQVPCLDSRTRKHVNFYLKKLKIVFFEKHNLSEIL